jgi:hypothetical protein
MAHPPRHAGSSLDRILTYARDDGLQKVQSNPVKAGNAMRVLMTVGLDTEKANQAIQHHTLEKTMESALGALKPEAAYFGSLHGKRTCFIVFDLEDPSDIPSVAEPLFQELGAEIDLTPVMSFGDVQLGLQKYNAH